MRIIYFIIIIHAQLFPCLLTNLSSLSLCLCALLTAEGKKTDPQILCNSSLLNLSFDSVRPFDVIASSWLSFSLFLALSLFIICTYIFNDWMCRLKIKESWGLCWSDRDFLFILLQFNWTVFVVTCVDIYIRAYSFFGCWFGTRVLET